MKSSYKIRLVSPAAYLGVRSKHGALRKTDTALFFSVQAEVASKNQVSFSFWRARGHFTSWRR